MCGISGVVDRRGGVPELPASLQSAIVFRGRDSQGGWSGAGAALCQARLAIIDPEGGDQPMTDASGRYTIVYSGEVYNYRELREEYKRAGVRFRTRSDTEVVLAGFALKGREVCRELNGMFAFAIWDAETRELVLARDRLGKKPLFWFATGDRVYFSSTLDAFADVPGWSGTLSRASLALFEVLGSIPGDRTVYEQARAVPPASTLTVADDRAPAVDRYWHLDVSRRSATPDADEEYDTLLTDAVRLRLRSDVPLAITFSGGVDSGSIAGLCAQRLGVPLTCYTIDHHTAEDPSEETVNAERAALELGLDWRFIQYDYHRDLLAELDACYEPYDQPSQQLALVYSERLYRTIRPHATVVLSGNGSDELFTGYRGDEDLRRRDLVIPALRPLRPLLRRIERLPRTVRLPVVEAFASSVEADVVARTADPTTADEARAAVRALAADACSSGVRTMLDLKLWAGLTHAGVDANYRLPDVSGLRAQVEVRSPFLDHRMVDFAARLAPQHKVSRPFRRPITKALPKRFYAGMVSDDLAYSAKKGMGANLRWDRSIAQDPAYTAAFADAYRALDEAGVGSAAARASWERYRADLARGGTGGHHAGPMIGGFMLGRWIQRTAARAGVQASVAA